MEKNPYVGKIGHAGTQVIQGNAKQDQKGKGSVKRGTDLRSGRNGK